MISLHNRTEQHVEIYFYKTRDKEIQTLLPQKAKTLEEALQDYQETLAGNVSSYGQTIYVNDQYVGDIWCYGIHKDTNPDAMVSYCIFEKDYWNQGVATKALELFLKDIRNQFGVNNIGAFTYSLNAGSIRVLEKNGFQLDEIFVEDGIESRYFLLNR